MSCAGLRMRSDPLILHESPPHRRRTAPVPCSLGLTGSQVSSHSRHRELGVPRNSCSSPRSKSCQTEVIQVSGQSAIESHKRAIRARNLLQTSYAEIVKDGTKSIDVAAFVQADISLQSRSSSSLPTQQSTITRVTPQPGNSVSATPTQERRYQVKPSLFNTTLSIMQNMQSCHNSTVPAGSKKRVSGYNSPIRNHTCTAQRGKSKKKLSHETKIKSIS